MHETYERPQHSTIVEKIHMTSASMRLYLLQPAKLKGRLQWSWVHLASMRPFMCPIIGTGWLALPLPVCSAHCFHLPQHHCLGILPTFLVNLSRVRIAPGSVLLKSIKKASSLLTRGVCSFILCVPIAISTVSFKSHKAATRRGETGWEFWRWENWACARRYEPVSPFAPLCAQIPGGPERQGLETKTKTGE